MLWISAKISDSVSKSSHMVKTMSRIIQIGAPFLCVGWASCFQSSVLQTACLLGCVQCVPLSITVSLLLFQNQLVALWFITAQLYGFVLALVWLRGLGPNLARKNWKYAIKWGGFFSEISVLCLVYYLYLHFRPWSLSLIGPPVQNAD